MGILRETQPQSPGPPPNTSPFSSDSVLVRTSRGDFKPTDADLEELRKLAQSGNRADRRAATKHLKRLGIAVPAATPASPVVVSTPTGAPSEPPASGKMVAQKDAPKKPAPKEAVAKKAPPKKAVPKHAAPKKTAPKKAAPGKTAAKKQPVKKSANKKTAVKKAPTRKR